LPEEAGYTQQEIAGNVLIENGSITGYKANLEIVFVLEEGEQPA
jgi:hypothetical protein